MKKSVKMPDDLMVEARKVKVDYLTRLEIQRKAQENGVNLTIPPAMKYTDALIQAGIAYENIWAQIYAVAEREGWDACTCGTISIGWQSGYATYDVTEEVPAPAEETEGVPVEADANE